MRKVICGWKAALVVAAAAAVLGASAGGSRAFVHEFPDKPQTVEVREQNRGNLAKLKAGMSRAEINRIMGTGVRKAYAGYQPVDIASPFREETVTRAGEPYEILYYYTALVKMDGKFTDDEMTPVVLKGGRLIGTGWDEFRKVVADSRPR